jgi:PAS domain S-box-containing protein
MLQGKVMPEYVELEIFRKDGTTRYLQTFHKEMLWDGKLRYQTLYNDISARKRAEEALQASEEKYRLIVENTLDIIFTTNIREEYVYVSPSVKNILGYEPAELIGRLFISLVHPDDLPGLQEEIQRSYGNNYRISEDREYRLRHASGEWRWVVSRGARVMDANDQFINFTGVISDITKRKAAEESLKASLAEKETLLKEVHHRVKNNMQVISSLLHLQEGRTKDKESQTVLKDSQNRIQSMALVYNKLYQSKNLANIPMTDYITELTGGLVKSYAARSSRVTVNVIPGDVSLSVDLAIPCGLVINELVTNAMKYAFPENRKGIINISLKEGNQENLVLTVVDDGVGIPADFDLVNTHTLGLKLVNSLVTDQLGGTIELDRTHGTAFKIVFPGSKEAKYGEGEDSGSGG